MGAHARRSQAIRGSSRNLILLLLILIWVFTTVLPAANATQIRGGINAGAAGRPLSEDPPPLETDLVLLTVSVTAKGASVPGLGQNRFQVIEDGMEQKITYFWVDNRPISVGFIMDGSCCLMTEKKNEAIRDAGAAFLKSKGPEDEYFVIVFSDAPAMTVSYTTDARRIPRVYSRTGETPLYDAIFNGLDAIKEAANPRKALIVMTAGGNSNRGVTADQLVSYAIKQPVQVYSLFLGADSTNQALDDSNVMDEIAGVTGGRELISSDDAFQVEAMSAELAQALKTQYLIGYKSTNTAKDGKRRGVKVKVSSPDGSPKLDVWTKSGYYSAKDPKVSTTLKGK